MARTASAPSASQESAGAFAAWTEVTRGMMAVPRYQMAVGTKDASQTALLNSISGTMCFCHTVLVDFFSPTCLPKRMSSSAWVLSGDSRSRSQ